ncbi:MAG TPA: metallophosphoesterase [Opitutaceae bacterium]|nr:metallophosphoesterase [Opitutaceae bacterium]
MAAAPIRIFSDIHFGDRLSQVTSLAQLTPLLQGVSRVILNGDTIDTRPGGDPALTRAWRAKAAAFAAASPAPLTFLTGNHDPDCSGQHALELAGGRVFLTHGDVIFDNIVPWGRDAGPIRARLSAALAALPAGGRGDLDARLRTYRQVAAGVRQRHQAERNFWRYHLRLAHDTIWPPYRLWRIPWAWLVAPGRTAALLRRHRPDARFILVGHTHRPGIWRRHGLTVINTGSFTRPWGAFAVDLGPDELVVRRIERREGRFHPGAVRARLALGGGRSSART